MITLIKNYRNKETLRLMEQKEVADMIRSGLIGSLPNWEGALVFVVYVLLNGF